MTRFVLCREVFFIQSVLYRRFHCTLHGMVGHWGSFLRREEEAGEPEKSYVH